MANTKTNKRKIIIDNGPIFAPKVFVNRQDQQYEYFGDTLRRIDSRLQKKLQPYRDSLNKRLEFPPETEVPREIIDANEAIGWIDELLSHEGQEGFNEYAIKISVRLGMALARAEVRPFEIAVEREIKRKEKLDARNAERAKLGTKIVEAVDEQIEQGRSSGHQVTIRGACRTLAKRKRFTDNNGEYLNENSIRNYFRKYK